MTKKQHKLNDLEKIVMSEWDRLFEQAAESKITENQFMDIALQEVGLACLRTRQELVLRYGMSYKMLKQATHKLKRCIPPRPRPNNQVYYDEHP
jgi:hypothetical protein